jgi:hypothetical protein
MLRAELNQCLVFFLAHYLNRFDFTVTLCTPFVQKDIEMEDFSEGNSVYPGKPSDCHQRSKSWMLNHICRKDSIYILYFAGQQYSTVNIYFASISTFEKRYKGSGYHFSKLCRGKYKLSLYIETDSELFKFCTNFKEQLFDQTGKESAEIRLTINLTNNSEITVVTSEAEVDYTWIHGCIF